MNTRLSIIGLSLAIVSPTIAATSAINVSLSADAGARWYEYFSGSYAELGSDWNSTPGIDGGFGIADGLELGGGYTAFPSVGNWDDVGTLTLDGMASGSGVETLTIVSADFDFSQYMADDDAIVGGYLTSFDSVSGSVELTDGVVTDLTFSGNIDFTYDFTGFAPGPIAFGGTLTIDETSFALDVDDTDGATGLRYVWDAGGTTSGLTVVPEPSSALLGGMAFLLVLRRRRV